MRLWTLHPRYLDAPGLVALWREALLARAVLRGKTRGYRHHPQLQRFQTHPAPRLAINVYLREILREAERRGYAFDRSKVGPVQAGLTIDCTFGQLAFEWQHLLGKLRVRSPAWHERWQAHERPQPHPVFRLKAGPLELWERVPAK